MDKEGTEERGAETKDRVEQRKKNIRRKNVSGGTAKKVIKKEGGCAEDG
jgi:hypothetical protein